MELTTPELAAILVRLQEWLEDGAATVAPVQEREAAESASDKIDAELERRDINGPDDFWPLLGHTKPEPEDQ
jgi:hypothetical protein